MRATWARLALATTTLAIACTTLKNGDEMPPGSSGGTSSSGAAGSAGTGQTAGAAGNAGSSGSQSGGASGSAGQGGAGGDGAMAGAGGDGAMGGAGGEPGGFGICPTATETMGITYYVCQCDEVSGPSCVDGDDTDAGTTPEKPLRTYDQARQAFAAMQAGDSVAFCLGGAFAVGEDNRWSNPRCTAKQPCSVRSYDAPWNTTHSLQLPRIDADAKPAFEIAGGEGYQLLGLWLSGSEDGVVVNSGTSDVLLCSLVLEKVRSGVILNAGAGQTRRVTLRSSFITQTTSSAVGISEGDCDSCSIEGNGLTQNGRAKEAGDGSDAIAIRTSQPMRHLRIVGNEIRAASDFTSNRCFSAGIGIYGPHDGVRIEGNVIDDVPSSFTPKECTGIVIDGTPLKDGVVSGNRVINRGAIAISATGCNGCTFENNAIGLQNETTYPAIGIQLGFTSGVVLQNNSIFFGTGSQGAASAGFDFSGPLIEGIVMANNVTLYRGKGAGFRCMARQSSAAGFATAFTYADYNACYSAAGAWYEGTLAEWSTATNLDDHSLDEDPKLVEMMTDTFLKPDIGSPLIGTGSPDHYTAADIDGTPRDYPPDIGAYQHPTTR